MASPQKENGCTDIANELLEAIYSFNFNGTQSSILLCVLRYTYGFKRKSHNLSISFIAKAINRNKVNVSKEVKNMIDNNVLIEYSTPDFKSTRKVGINKDYDKWKGSLLVNRLTGSQNTCTTVSAYTNRGVSERANQETKNKTKNKTKNVESESFNSIWELYPKKEGKTEALRKYLSLNGEVKDEVIIQGIRNYKSKIEKEGIEYRYIKMGSTWFEGECWNDDYKAEEKRNGCEPGGTPLKKISEGAFKI